mgnify:CR=1 FL=1
MNQISNMASVAQMASRYSQRMDNLKMLAATDPTIVEDPGKVADFQIEMMNAQQAFQLASRAIQDVHKEDQILSELLRDA